MSRYEITQIQWKAVTGRMPGIFNKCGINCPIEQVSWKDVREYIQRLNNLSGKHYRLPTEEEWYSACQAGSKNVYCGSNNIDEVAWYESNSGGGIHVVGQKQPNAWGLYDMSGNVWEWTSSCWEDDCTLRVVRGGSFFETSLAVRSTYRFKNNPLFKSGNLGFRLVQDR